MKNSLHVFRFILAVLILSLFSQGLKAQGRGEIWSKNVELISMAPGHSGHEYLWKEKVVFGSTEKVVIPRAIGTSYRITDVTNPRSATLSTDGVTIKVQKVTPSTDLIDFNSETHGHAIWKDQSTSTTFPHGHTFGIVEVNPSQALVVDLNENGQYDNGDVKARYLIFDISQAMSRVASSGSSSKTIIVAHVDDRRASFDDVSGTFTDVYVGYIPEATSKAPHNLRIESELGIMLASGSSAGSQGTVDLQLISSIFSQAELTSTTTTDFAKPTQLTMSGGGFVSCDPTGSGSLVGNHEVVGEKIDENTIRIYAALFGSGNTSTKGGVLIEDVDFTTPSSCSVSIKNHWNYHNDRTSASKRLSAISNWELSTTHTAVPYRHDGNSYVLTLNEFFSSSVQRESDGTPQSSVTTSSTESSLDGFTYTNLILGRKYDGTHEDYRLHGDFLRIWNFEESDEDNPEIVGTGTDNGPLGLYDVPERTSSDLAAGTHSPILSVSGMGAIDADASSSTKKKRGVNTMHHIQTIDGDPDIYLSGYTAGARIINISSFPSTPTLKEKAFFDFYPTLTYDFSTSNNPSTFTDDNHYFCFNSGGHSTGSEGFYHNFVSVDLPQYFMGIEDVMPDYGRSANMQADEKFMYAMGWGGEGKVGLETENRNYINGGGFFVLRYFDDKIGGTITGYTGTNSTFDRSFREVNLQGIFEVSRDVTVASGATVNLLKDTELKPDASPGECLIIDGTVNVQTLAAEFTSTTGRGVIDVPVLVRSGGRLVIKSGAVVDFTKKVTVDLGGELTIESGAKVVFANAANVCNGKFLVNGTTTSRSKICAALNTGRTSTVGNSYFIMKGNPSLGSLSKLQISFADIENVCFDAVDITPGTPQMLNQSTFSAHTTSIKPYLVNYRRKSYGNFTDALTVVKIANCTFKDRNRECLDYEESHSGRYESCIDRSYNIHGLGFSNVLFGEISNTNFSHLLTGAYLDKGFIMNVKSCTLSYSNQGIINASNAMILCDNTFHGVEIGYQAVTSLASFVYDNKIFKSSISALNISGSSHFYRGNRFEDYCTGIFGWNSSLQLRDHLSNDVWNKLGRNQFLTTDPALMNPPPPAVDSIPIYGIYGCSVNDIHLSNSQLLIHCGFNYFSEFSALHVFTGGVGTFNPGYNQWDDIGGSIVRTDANVAGTPLNTSQTVGASCNRVDIDPPCPVSVCVQGIYIVEYIGQDSFVRASYNGVWANVKDSTLSLDCRKIAAHELAEMAVTLDSDLYYSNTITRLDSVYSKTSNPPILRSTALMLKGSLLERMDSTSAALYAYSNIVTNFTSYPDSIPAAWRIQYLNAVIDTVNYDSLIRLYHIRVLNDTRRMTFIDDPAYKMAGQMPDHQTSDIQATISLEQNVPNPWDSHTDISFTLPVSGFTTLKVIDILGNEVKILINGEAKAGRNVVNFKASDLPEGVYFYRLQYGNQVITKKMQKNR